ncbi:MAG: AmmeMemoRadiSam system radical SAM enzyme [Planctomycetota bacterium]|nr:AmmeMemoRadiSam system radical SAM enzyme [Planctomycetota bacterium]
MSEVSSTEALYYIKRENNTVFCQLCPQGCRIGQGEVGRCGVRRNENGKLIALSHSRITSVALDPIEKKPLYHFHPATEILSVGAFGCSFRCLFCQNHEISQGGKPWGDEPSERVTPRPPMQTIRPRELITLALRYNSFGISYTYNEPFIWFEYLLECSKLARQNNLKNVLVSNGYINPEPLSELIPFMDAINIDIKSMDDSFYERLCGAHLKPVLNTCIALKKAGVHLEVTNLIVTGENDSERNFIDLRDWIYENLGDDTPTHLSAYFPHYKFNAPQTPLETVRKAFDIVSEKLPFTYMGNVWRSGQGSDTLCRKCKTILVKRLGYSVKVLALTEQGNCVNCGTPNNFILH